VKRALFAGLALVCFGRTALAEEANVGAVGNVGAAPAPVRVSASGDRFAAPNGQLGAGLTASPEQRARAFGEMSLISSGQSYAIFGNSFDLHITSLSFLVGGGYKLTDNLELQAMLPFVWAHYSASTTENGVTQSESESQFAVANLHLGLSYFQFSGPLRFMVGGALQYGPWTPGLSDEGKTTVALGHPAMGGESIGLWAAEAFSIVTPARLEYAIPKLPALVLSGDAALGLHIPTGGGDTEFTIQLSPGVGYYATDTVLVGLRLPFTLMPTESGSSATFFAMQPYGRFDFGAGFLDASLVLNVDEPYGFAFDDGRFWALRVGGGGSF
jgi:hypothetical protein